MRDDTNNEETKGQMNTLKSSFWKSRQQATNHGSSHRNVKDHINMNKVSRLLNCTLAMLVVLGLVGANRAMADDASDKAAAIKAKAAAKAAAINEYLAKH